MGNILLSLVIEMTIILHKCYYIMKSTICHEFAVINKVEIMADITRLYSWLSLGWPIKSKSHQHHFIKWFQPHP